MSVWRMEIDISFSSKAEMLAMMNFMEAIHAKFQQTQEGGLPIPCQVRWHECNHDIGGSCSKYEVVEFDGETDHGASAVSIVTDSIKKAVRASVEAQRQILEGRVATLSQENKELAARVPGPRDV